MSAATIPCQPTQPTQMKQSPQMINVSSKSPFKSPPKFAELKSPFMQPAKFAELLICNVCRQTFPPHPACALASPKLGEKMDELGMGR